MTSVYACQIGWTGAFALQAFVESLETVATVKREVAKFAGFTVALTCKFYDDVIFFSCFNKRKKCANLIINVFFPTH